MNPNALTQAILSFAKTTAGKAGQAIGNAAQGFSRWASPPALSPVPEPTRSSLFQPGGIKQAVNNVVALSTFRPQLMRPFQSGVQAASAPIQQNRTTPTQIPSPTSFPTRTPSSTPTPIPTRTQPSSIRIAIPSASGTGETIVPEPAATAIFKAFEPYKEATTAAQVLHHPMQVSGTPQEIKRGINWWGNIGENPSFSPTAVNLNKGGSVDTGLFQINSDTFRGMMADDFWRKALARRGITSYEQMKDPYKNAVVASLILMRGNFDRRIGSMLPSPSYIQWYGAPQTLRMR